MKGRHFLALLFGMMLLIGAAAYWTWKHGGALECRDHIVEESISTDGRYVAARFERSCGGGAPATHVALRARAAAFTNEDDVYVATGSPRVRLQWSAARELSLEADRPSVIPERLRWRDVRVEIKRR